MKQPVISVFQFIKPDVRHLKKAWRNLQSFQLDFPFDVFQNEGKLINLCAVCIGSIWNKGWPWSLLLWAVRIFYQLAFQHRLGARQALGQQRQSKAGPEPSPPSAWCLCLHLSKVRLKEKTHLAPFPSTDHSFLLPKCVCTYRCWPQLIILSVIGICSGVVLLGSPPGEGDCPQKDFVRMGITWIPRWWARCKYPHRSWR